MSSVGGSVAVTGTFWQTTQPVSGTVTANQGGAPWSVTFPSAQHVIVDNSSIAVTGTFWQTTQPVSVAATVNVQAVPATSGGLSFYNASVAGTKAAVKASAGQLYGYHILNTTAAIAYVQCFNVASASVTVGTTTPDFVLGLPANGGATFIRRGPQHHAGFGLA